MVRTSNITMFSERKRKSPKKSTKLSPATIQKVRNAAVASKRKRNAEDEAKRKRGRSITRRMKNTVVNTARRVKRKITGKSKYKNVNKESGKGVNNWAATKIQAAARGYMARKPVIGLTAAQKRALNPVVSNNIFYNAPAPRFQGARTAAEAVLKIYPRIETAVLDKVVKLAKYLATRQGGDFTKSFGNIVMTLFLAIHSRKVPGMKAIFNLPNPPTTASIASSALSAWLQYWSPASLESKIIFEILFTPDFIARSRLSMAGFAFMVVTSLVAAVAFLTRNTPVADFKMSSMVKLLRAFFMEKALKVAVGKGRALMNTPRLIQDMHVRYKRAVASLRRRTASTRRSPVGFPAGAPVSIEPRNIRTFARQPLPNLANRR
jgi:hypothetical protein